MLLDGIIAISLLSLSFVSLVPNLLYSQKVEVSNEQDVKAVLVAEQKRDEIETLTYDDIKSEVKTNLGNGFSTEVVVAIGSQEEKNIAINVYDSITNNLLITVPVVVFNDRKVICKPTYGQKYIDGKWVTLTTSETYEGTPCDAVDANANTSGTGTYWYILGNPPTGGNWIKLDYGINNKQVFNQVQLQGLAVSGSYLTNSFKDVVIYGSNDDKTYVTLGSGIGQNNYLMQFFNINNNTAYRFYRINIPSSYGRSSSSATFCDVGKCVGLQELQMRSVSSIKNFGAYRAWSDGTYAKSALEYINGDATHSYSGDTGDGIYRIQATDGTLVDIYCDMTNNGGGWMRLSSTIATLTPMNGATVYWNGEVVNGYGKDSTCNSSQRFVFGLSSVKVPYSQAYVLLHRTTTILQCSRLTDTGTASGYFTSPYKGTYTSYPMCQWGDNIWARNPPNVSASDLRLDWIMMYSGSSGFPLRYIEECSNGYNDTGFYTQQWFVR